MKDIEFTQRQDTGSGGDKQDPSQLICFDGTVETRPRAPPLAAFLCPRRTNIQKEENPHKGLYLNCWANYRGRK